MSRAQDAVERAINEIDSEAKRIRAEIDKQRKDLEKRIKPLQGQLSDLETVEAQAMQAFHDVAQRGPHAFDLMITTLVQGHHNLAWARAFDLARQKRLIVILEQAATLAQLFQLLGRGRLSQIHSVDFVDLRTG